MKNLTKFLFVSFSLQKDYYLKKGLQKSILAKKKISFQFCKIARLVSNTPQTLLRKNIFGENLKVWASEMLQFSVIFFSVFCVIILSYKKNSLAVLNLEFIYKIFYEKHLTPL